MNFEFFALTHPGRTRANNEDAVALDPDNQLVVLADGMGGYNAGEVASAMATAAIQTELGRWLSQAGPDASVRDIRQAMEACTHQANRAIFNAANTNPQFGGMGTTLVMGVFHHKRALIGHVGDSRCYRWRAGRLSQLTRDHTVLQQQIDAGLISARQAQYAAHRHLVTRALGIYDAVCLEVSECRAQEGDLYLLCSDGLNDMIDDERIAALLAAPEPLPQKGQALIDAANERGGRDNISVILVQASSQPVRRGLLSRLLGQQDRI